MKISIVIFIFILLFSGCTKTPQSVPPQIPKAKASGPLYVENLPKIDSLFFEQKSKQYNERFFKPWQMSQVSSTKEDAMWGFVYAKRTTYGHNYQPISPLWFEKQKSNSHFETYNSDKIKAITIQNTNLRVFPTTEPIFFDPTKAGEGFPFDYNQISAIYINTPLIISHFSKDKAWAFVESSFATGWIDVHTIVAVTKEQQKIFQSGYYGMAHKDNFPLYDLQKNFVSYIKLGTLFPIYKGNLLYIRKTAPLKGKISYADSPYVTQKPLPFTKENVSDVLLELLDEPYGWGGLHNTRDCSSMTRDFFALFGIFLERNSKGQTYNGKYISLEGLTHQEKKGKILQEGIPFLTLLYAKGHVMLYVGIEEKEPIIFHQFWGIQTKDSLGVEGRDIIGKTLFSTLEIGKDHPDFDPNGALIEKILGMVQLY